MFFSQDIGGMDEQNVGRPKKALVIFNPISGKKSQRNISMLIKKRLESLGWRYDWYETQKTPRQPYDTIIDPALDRIIVVGGDGTIGDVAAYLARHRLKIPMVLIPKGSGNLLAWGLKIFPFAVSKTLTLGLRGRPRDLDMILINREHYALLNAGAGFDTFLMRRTDRKLKRRLGFWAYVWVFLRTIRKYPPACYRLTIDARTFTVEAVTILGVNIAPFSDTRIGRFFFKDKVLPDDGWIDVYILKPFTFSQILNIPSKIEKFKGRRVIIEFDAERHLQIDGEVMKGRSVQMDVVPAAVRIVDMSELCWDGFQSSPLANGKTSGYARFYNIIK